LEFVLTNSKPKLQDTDQLLEEINEQLGPVADMDWREARQARTRLCVDAVLATATRSLKDSPTEPGGFCGCGRVEIVVATEKFTLTSEGWVTEYSTTSWVMWKECLLSSAKEDATGNMLKAISPGSLDDEFREMQQLLREDFKVYGVKHTK
jgi:hypothetical protein